MSFETRPSGIIIPSPLKILHVDDESMPRVLVKQYLKGDEYDLQSIEDPRGVLDLLGNNPRHIVITDGQMPFMYGEVLSQKIEKHIQK